MFSVSALGPWICYSLFVFSIDGPKQNAGSHLTPVSNIVFYALSSGTHSFALHGSFNTYSTLPNKRTGTFIFLKPKFPPVRNFITLVSHSVPSYSHIKTVNWVGLLRSTNLHTYLIELTSWIEENFGDQCPGTFIRTGTFIRQGRVGETLCKQRFHNYWANALCFRGYLPRHSTYKSSLA